MKYNFIKKNFLNVGIEYFLCNMKHQILRIGWKNLRSNIFLFKCIQYLIILISIITVLTKYII